MTAHLMEQPTAAILDFHRVRQDSERLAEPYSEADQTIQSMPDASPVKWHLAHTTWFFETFLLKPFLPEYRVFDPHYEVLFNSYYNSVGEQFPRPQRGLISRPGKDEVLRYRQYVNQQMDQLLASAPATLQQTLAPLLELGLHHEQQHQELLVTDIQHALSINPLNPVITKPVDPFPPASALNWVSVEEGLYEVGFRGRGFSFDNELPRHQVYLYGFSAADRLITNAEFQAFMLDGGYDNPLYWLSEGWAWKQQQAIQAPLYWKARNGDWFHYSLAGLTPVDPNAPVTHVSFFEANAYANWASARLLTEFEWEVLAQVEPVIQHTYNPDQLQPAPAPRTAVQQLYNCLWQWTGSQYLPYPGFKTPEGAVGEYNGKFMSNQFVLRGGSCATPPNHVRDSYRNFFPATARWQFTGIRIAKDD